MKVAVLGSGNGACAIAFEWAINGHEVSIFDFEQFPEMIRQINKNSGLTSKGKLEGEAKFSYVGHDIEKALQGAELIFAVGPAYSTESFGAACKPYIKADQIYVICPTSCFGSIAFKNAAGLDLNDKSVVVAETSTLPYAVRITGEAEITIYNHLKGGFFIAAFPASLTKKAHDAVSQVHNILMADSIVQTSFQNGNPTIHPAVTLLNAARIENPEDFMFYEDGVTTGVGRLMKKVDEEKIAIAEAFGVKILPEPTIGVIQGYMVEENYDTGYSKAPGFKGILAQRELDHRYFNEDVGYTLVCYIDIANKLGIETPIMDALTLIISVVMEREYLTEARRSLETMGLNHLNKDELLTLLS